MKICIVLGTRPEIIKLYGLIKECKAQNLDFYVIHTGQHYDDDMSKNFFDELGLPRENRNLKASNISRVGRFYEIQKRLLFLWSDYKPDIVIVQGDTDSAMVAGLTAKMMGIKIAHVEAGLRSNSNIPEEYNRRMIDQIADYLFCPTVRDYERIIQEDFMGKAYCVGNTVVDCVNSVEKHKTDDDFVFMTLHRDTNVDNKGVLEDILNQTRKLSENIFFACHPRTKKRIEEFGLEPYGLKISPPLSYKETIQRIDSCKYVITDSGGVQEEASCLGKKCIIVRDSTERKYKGSMLRKGDMYKVRHMLLDDRNEIENPFNPNNSTNISKDILSIILQDA